MYDITLLVCVSVYICGRSDPSRKKSGLLACLLDGFFSCLRKRKERTVLKLAIDLQLKKADHT